MTETTETGASGEDAARPWAVSDDPKPEPFDADGRWTSDYIAWSRREALRRANYHAEAHAADIGRTRGDS